MTNFDILPGISIFHYNCSVYDVLRLREIKLTLLLSLNSLFVVTMFYCTVLFADF